MAKTKPTEARVFALPGYVAGTTWRVGRDAFSVRIQPSALAGLDASKHVSVRLDGWPQYLEAVRLNRTKELTEFAVLSTPQGAQVVAMRPAQAIVDAREERVE